MTKARQRTGQQGEELACQFLENHQYRILERNFRCTLGEIDIVARNGEYLVFCEVKTRKGSGPIHPTASITSKKLGNYANLDYCIFNKKICINGNLDSM